MTSGSSMDRQDSIMSSAAEEPIAVSLDIGSSSVRAMAFDRRGRAITDTASQQAYELDTRFEGQVTIDAGVVFDMASRCLDETHAAIVDSPLAVGAVGISCFWHSLLGLDREGSPVTPVYHLADNRSADIVDGLRSSHDETAWKGVTGTVFHSSFWPAKLLWLRTHHASLFSTVARWSSAGDYVSEMLLGARATSICMASGTGMCEVATGEWSSELASIAGVPLDALPPVVDRHVAAYLRPDARKRWPRFAEAPWFPALGDGACANVGSGAIDPQRIALTLGTTGALRVLDYAPIGASVPGYPGLWTYRLDGKTAIHGAAITNGGIWFDYMRDMLHDSSDTLLAKAFALPPGAHGLTVLPFLAGERAPLWNDRARAVIAGLSPGTTRADIARASLEAVAHRLALVYKDVAPAACQDHLIVANGAALLRSAGLQQMISDALERPIVTLPASLEASARGAAICALESAGIIKSLGDVDDLVPGSPSIAPDFRNAGVYRRERERQEALRLLLYPGSSSWDRP